MSTLDPVGPEARAVAQVWWWMFGVAIAVLLGVVALWLLAMRRNRMPGPDETTRVGRRWIIGGGIVLPAVATTALVVFGAPSGLHRLPLPIAAGEQQPLLVNVTGHQFWWELQYPETGVRLVNELRLPVGRPVEVHTRSADVIHSFWVPRLGGKIDAVPGHVRVLRLRADEAGTFRGQCAEFCGREHAHMTMIVHAMPVDEFESWLAGQASAIGSTQR
jgi:cytochrome c oxidase subunit II